MTTIHDTLKDIFYINVPVRRTQLEVLQSKLQDGWKCDGHPKDYRLRHKNEQGSEASFETIAELRWHCECEEILTKYPFKEIPVCNAENNYGEDL